MDDWNKSRLDTKRFDNQLGNGKLLEQKNNRDSASIYKSPIAYGFHSYMKVTPLINSRSNPKSQEELELQRRKDAAQYGASVKARIMSSDYEGISGGKVIGEYNPKAHTIYAPTEEVLLHELAHASKAAPQEEAIKNILGGENNAGTPYYDRPTEIYSRLMELREANNIDPNKEWTEDEVKNLRKTGIDFNILNRYKPKQVTRLFNEVALVTPKLNNLEVLFAKSGLKFIPKALEGTKTKKVDWELVRKNPEYKKFNWKMNPKNLSIILDSLINRGADRVELIAVFSQVIPENGGNTTPHGNGAYGLVGWRGSRAKGLSSNISGLTNKLMNEIYSNPKAVDWSHGGEGMGILSGKEMYEFFKKTPVTRKAVNAFMRGYVRPPLDLYQTRLNFAKFLEKYF